MPEPNTEVLVTVVPLGPRFTFDVDVCLGHMGRAIPGWTVPSAEGSGWLVIAWAPLPAPPEWAVQRFAEANRG